MYNRNIALVLTSISALSSLSAVATPMKNDNGPGPKVQMRGGHGAGNGGGGEILFSALIDRISQWMNESSSDGTLDAKLHLADAGLTSSDFLKAYASVATTTSIKFVPANKLDDECERNQDKVACRLRDTSRTCVNETKPTQKIECNEDAFNKRAGDEQFVLALHEMLGVAGIETDDSEKSSRYPISKYLLAFANPRTVVRWELSKEARPAPAPVKTGCKMFIRVEGSAAKYLSPQLTGTIVKGYEIVSNIDQSDLILSLKDYGGEFEETSLLNQVMPSSPVNIHGIIVPTIIHRQTGFSHEYWFSNMEVTRSSTWINPRNQAALDERAKATTPDGYAAANSKIDPSLNREIPGKTGESETIRLINQSLTSCSEYYHPLKSTSDGQHRSR